MNLCRRKYFAGEDPGGVCTEHPILGGGCGHSVLLHLGVPSCRVCLLNYAMLSVADLAKVALSALQGLSVPLRGVLAVIEQETARNSGDVPGVDK